MDSFHQVRVPGERLEGERIIGLQQVSDIELLRVEINELLPGEGIFQVTPKPLNRVQLRTIRWQPHGSHMLRPPQALGGVGATVIQEQDVQAVGEGLREGVHAQLEPVSIQRGEFQEAVLARGWGDGAIDREPFAGGLEDPERLDPLGRESPSAHRQQATTTFVRAEHAHRAGILRWDDALELLLTSRLEVPNGLRGFLCAWGAPP
jgi:hypothetical protein